MSSGNGIGSYLYWSERAVQAAAEDNGIDPRGRQLRWAVTLTAKWLQANLAGSDRVTRNRLAEARRVEKRIGSAAAEDFSSPPPAAFVKGVGRVSFSEFVVDNPRRSTVIMHVRTNGASGQRIDICLFGSMDNLRGFQSHDGFQDGWTSSAARAIEELLDSRGSRNTSQWDDEQSRAVEVLNVALHQGTTGRRDDHAGKPETRGYTIGHARECHFFGEVYTDVVLDPARWDLDGEMIGAQRIVVGRPLWVRTRSLTDVVRYAELRNLPGRRTSRRRTGR